MPTTQLIADLMSEFTKIGDGYKICGVVDESGMVYPLGADTKVLSTIFELIARPLVSIVADKNGYKVIEPSVQNHYPDFTLHLHDQDKKKIAIDIKTTYRNKPTDKFSYTLGGYTSFIRPGNETKNIVFPFTHYEHHLVIGFIYDRVAQKKSASHKLYTVNELSQIVRPYKNVEVFVQDKWRIASDKAGSGNTTNIGSISGTLNDFVNGNGPFTNEEEFLNYWRGYGKTAANRSTSYKNIIEYRTLKQ
jgi:hypothetical protein